MLRLALACLLCSGLCLLTGFLSRSAAITAWFLHLAARSSGGFTAYGVDTPMVPLGRIAAGLATPVLGKCEHLNPGGSIKDRIALAIVNDAEERG